MTRPEDLTPHWVNRLSFALRKELVSRFQKAGLRVSAEEWGAMLILNEGPCTPGQLSEKTLRDRTTVTRLVDRLAARGFVIRETDRNDRRRQVLRLSRAGYTEFAEMAVIAGALIGRCNRDIPPSDIAIANGVLQRMLANITTGTADGETQG